MNGQQHVLHHVLDIISGNADASEAAPHNPSEKL
jgi:hypothetical protein